MNICWYWRFVVIVGDWGQIFFLLCVHISVQGIFLLLFLSLWVNITKNQCWMSWGCCCMQQKSTMKGMANFFSTFKFMLETREPLNTLQKWFHFSILSITLLDFRMTRRWTCFYTKKAKTWDERQFFSWNRFFLIQDGGFLADFPPWNHYK